MGHGNPESGISNLSSEEKVLANAPSRTQHDEKGFHKLPRLGNMQPARYLDELSSFHYIPAVERGARYPRSRNLARLAFRIMLDLPVKLPCHCVSQRHCAGHARDHDSSLSPSPEGAE